MNIMVTILHNLIIDAFSTREVPIIILFFTRKYSLAPFF